MSVAIEQIQKWMNVPSENEHLEFKEAKNNFDFEKLVRYCAAFANEKGGKMIFGVTDKRPRRIVGSHAFSEIEQTKARLIHRLHLRIDIDEIQHPDGRVLVFHIPSRPIGTAIQVDGTYWMRGGEELVPMTPDMLKRIFLEGGLDFSNEICEKATIEDLEPMAVDDFRRRWQKKTQKENLATLPLKQLLQDAELIFEDKVTYAALVLLGKRLALTRYLPNAEVVFEYRSSESSIEFQQREEFRQGFFLFYDKLWELVNLHNDLQHFQDGLFVWDIPTFNEKVIREAILNAVCHRDYRREGSIFVRQFPRKIEIISHGGFPEGITLDNLLYWQSPRNRRIAEGLARCGLVERSGQGFDTIFRQCIQETKPLPEFTGTDDYHVCLSLQGVVQDAAFLRFLEKIGAETQKSFGIDDFLLLDILRTGKKIPGNLTYRLPYLREKGIIELLSKGRGAHYILSKKFYTFSGNAGIYTRHRGLDRETNKALLLNHLKHHRKGTIKEFQEVLPTLTRDQIHSLLKELKKEKHVRFVGQKKSGYWELIV